MSFAAHYLKKLDEVEKRFEELTAQLGDPAVVNDRDKYTQIAREHSDLSEIVETYRRYKKVLKDIADNKELLEDADEEIAKLAREELKELEAEREALEKRLMLLLVPKDPNDEKNIMLEIRAGTGGEEAALFAADLFRMYSRYAERKGWEVEILDVNPTGLGGFKEIIAMIKGKGAYSRLKYESGVHRVQRIPETESGGRIHTSAVTVAVLPEAEEVDVEIRPEDLKIDTMRASGAGGQHVNKTESAVRITHIPTGIVVYCANERSQHQNRAKAMQILRTRLYEIKLREQEEKIRAERRSQVGSGDRSERIRTYNFPQNRITDHRIGLTLYKLEQVLDGDLDDIIDSLITYYQTEALKEHEQVEEAA
ncbi:peptide chain release factor 1 [Thermodesulfatator indicus DSM 15286]|uniref:Peptide chain release factor 1 n=1 Tax=Thermodesulfatator indicus (strain DSM 15286 / JCM 11887 / CIR29812) TaxID=667014 RepID=F8ABC3_THEID|nr:peptide chain release factor 1 [Thermodesulfatator indicus]AEH44433.1 peptide chain release factor 1 [Thermodesulfatator indicus DSM 15286]